MYSGSWVQQENVEQVSSLRLPSLCFTALGINLNTGGEALKKQGVWRGMGRVLAKAIGSREREREKKRPKRL